MTRYGSFSHAWKKKFSLLNYNYLRIKKIIIVVAFRHCILIYYHNKTWVYKLYKNISDATTSYISCHVFWNKRERESHLLVIRICPNFTRSCGGGYVYPRVLYTIKRVGIREKPVSFRNKRVITHTMLSIFGIKKFPSLKYNSSHIYPLLQCSSIVDDNNDINCARHQRCCGEIETRV